MKFIRVMGFLDAMFKGTAVGAVALGQNELALGMFCCSIVARQERDSRVAVFNFDRLAEFIALSMGAK